jgi:hypothetical protein
MKNDGGYENPGKTMRLVDSVFSSYVNGSVRVHYTPPLPAPIEQCTPFVVRCSGNHWIPMQVIVWATSEQTAIDRVLSALRHTAQCTREYAEAENAERVAEARTQKEADPDGFYSYNHVQAERECARILKKLDAGEMEFEAEPYDKDVITYCLPWASNGGAQ